MTRSEWLTAGAAIGAGLLAISVWRVQDQRDADLEPSQLRWSALISSGHFLGRKDAEFKIVEFGDILCGHCVEFAATAKELRARYPEHVAIVYRHFVRSKSSDSFKLALAAECAGAQERFEPFLMAASQRQWLYVNDGAILAVAASAGVDDIRLFETCMIDMVYAHRIEEDTRVADGLGFPGTPGLVINGVVMEGGALSLPILEGMLAQTLRR